MFRALIVSATTASVKRAMYTVKDTGMVGVDMARYGDMYTFWDTGMVGVDTVRYGDIMICTFKLTGMRPWWRC